jgi:hypothetical protein
MKNTRALALCGLFLAVALSASSCGGGKPFSEATDPTPTSGPTALTPSTVEARLLASVQRATNARTARMTMVTTTSGLGTDGDLTLTGTGVIDLANRRGQMTLTTAAAGQSVSFEMRIVDNTVFLDTGDGWVSQTAANSAATDPSTPSNYLAYLQGVSNDARIDGHDVLHGDNTTRYAATLDLRRALTRTPDAARRALVQHAVEEFGITKLPSTVWVDDAGRLRKVEMTIDLSGVAARLDVAPGGHPKIVESMEMFDFGVPVDVVAPKNAAQLASPAAHRAQVDLRNAMTAAKTAYTDTGFYSTDLSQLKAIEPTLDWGGKLTVGVGPDGTDANQVVCLSEAADGVTYALGDVSSEPLAGVYYGRKGCPRVVNATTVAALGSHW